MCPMKYSIVVFLQGNSTSVVPTSWTFQKDNGDWMCYWPRYYGAKQLEAVVKQNVSSQPSWKIYACRILRRFDTYQSAEASLERALVESDLGTELSDCDNGILVTEVQQPAEVKQLTRTRGKRISLSCLESDEDSTPPKKKKSSSKHMLPMPPHITPPRINSLVQNNCQEDSSSYHGSRPRYQVDRECSVASCTSLVGRDKEAREGPGEALNNLQNSNNQQARRKMAHVGHSTELDPGTLARSPAGKCRIPLVQPGPQLTDSQQNTGQTLSLQSPRTPQSENGQQCPELTSTPRHLQSRNNQLNMQVSTPQTPRSLRSQNSHGDCGGDPVPQTPRITQSRCSQRSRTSTPQSRSNHTEYVQASTPQAPRSLRSENSREDCGRGSVSKTPRTAESRCSQRRRTSTPLTPQPRCSQRSRVVVSTPQSSRSRSECRNLQIRNESTDPSHISSRRHISHTPVPSMGPNHGRRHEGFTGTHTSLSASQVPNGQPGISPGSALSSIDRKILMLLEQIKLQGQTVIALQQQLLTTRNEQETLGPTNIEQRLPVTTLEELELLNTDAMTADICGSLTRFLGLAGGSSVGETTRAVMRRLMSTKVAQQTNWLGKGKKTAFSKLKLREIVSDAVRRNPLTCRATDAEVASVIKEWLKHARDRDGGRSVRRQQVVPSAAGR